MTSEFEIRLSAVGQTTLTPLVRQALDNETIEVIDWSYQLIQGGFADQTVGGHGTYRFAGQAQAGEQRLTWSLILKVLGKSHNTGSDDPADWNYWKREILAYQSGLLDNLPGGLSAPRCFGVIEYPNQEFWIWLEEISEAIGAEWPMAQYALAARHLGQFNGAYLMGYPIPAAAWLTQGRVRNWLKLGDPILRDLRRLAEHPLIRRWLTGNSLDRTLALWAYREQLIDRLDRLPRSLCHHDAFRRNLLARRDRHGTSQTVAVDWSMVGTGAIGEEIAPLIAVSLQFFEVDIAQAAELEATVFENYLAGLSDAGWRGDPRLVRFGFTAAAALFLGVGGVGLWLPSFLEDEMLVVVERVLGQPVDRVLERFAALQAYLLDLGDEARALAANLS